MKYLARILIGILLMLAALFCLGLAFGGFGYMIWVAILFAAIALYVGVLCGYFLLPKEEDKENTDKEN